MESESAVRREKLEHKPQAGGCRKKLRQKAKLVQDVQEGWNTKM